MANPLAVFFTQPVKVKRLLGSSPYGDQHDVEATILCRVKRGEELVRDAEGREVVASASASMDAGTAPIPPGSMALLPGDSVWRIVISSSAHVGGFDRSPDYYSITVQ